MYDSLLEVQSKDYDNKSTFETAFGNLSDSAFILYSPSTANDTEEIKGAHGKFGYVYNILLPFSSAQSQQLTSLQNARDNDIYSESEYFIERNKLLKNIVTKDQREAGSTARPTIRSKPPKPSLNITARTRAEIISSLKTI